MNQNCFGISSALFSSPTYSDWDSVLKAGFHCVELSIQSHKNFDRAEEYLLFGEKMVHEIREAGLTIWSLHIPFGSKWNIASLDEKERQRVVKEICILFKKSKHWYYKVAVIHGSIEPIEDLERFRVIQQCRKSIQELSQYLQYTGVTLAIECLPRSCVGNVSQEIKWLIEGTEAKVCFDVNHLLKESHQDFFSQVGEDIITTHLSDYDSIDECHWIPGKGVINWGKLSTGFEKAGYTGPLLFEISAKRLLPGEIITPAEILQAYKKAIMISNKLI